LITATAPVVLGGGDVRDGLDVKNFHTQFARGGNGAIMWRSVGHQKVNVT
jgi:hypothetical protein